LSDTRFVNIRNHVGLAQILPDRSDGPVSFGKSGLKLTVTSRSSPHLVHGNRVYESDVLMIMGHHIDLYSFIARPNSVDTL
jgi:hypothetical protein